MSDIVAAGVRTGLGAHTQSEADHSMRWHHKHQLWLTSKPWDAYWHSGMIVIAFQSGAGRGKVMRGVAIDAETINWGPNHGSSDRGHVWPIAKNVAWEAREYRIPNLSHVSTTTESLLAARNLRWLDEQMLNDLLTDLVVAR